MTLQIEPDISNQTIDFSLNKYKGLPEQFAPTEKTIVEYWAKSDRSDDLSSLSPGENTSVN